ncbi:unnamed protein product [Symbiodinium sp. CCMP2592]|nr:unnamed protein product [Symbiodinium sp. CCMP2592]
MQLFTWMFALFALVINGVAAHRISTHSIDTSGSFVMKEERRGFEYRAASAIKEKDSTINQQASRLERLRQPGHFVWNISGEDFSKMTYSNYVDSPKFALLHDGGFWLRYYPKGQFWSFDGWASVYLMHDTECSLYGSMTADSVSTTIGGLSTSWGRKRFLLTPKLHGISVNLTKSHCEVAG